MEAMLEALKLFLPLYILMLAGFLGYEIISRVP
jgi:hypothetical protein